MPDTHPFDRPIPEHHKQWFAQLQQANDDGRLALVAGKDATTGEYRTMICLIGGPDKNDEYTITPVGNMAHTDNPFDAYHPPALTTH